MQRKQILLVGMCLWLSTCGMVYADTGSPPPATSPPVVSEPTGVAPPPVADTPAPVQAYTPPPMPTSVPVQVEPDKHPYAQVTVAPIMATAQPAGNVNRPVLPAPSPVSASNSGPSPSNPSSPAPRPGGAVSSSNVSPLPAPASGPPTTSQAVQIPTPGLPDPVSVSPPSSIDVNVSNTSAQAPAQLHCHGKPKPYPGPFLVSPYSGWTSVNSFEDHDAPDYSVDGKIVLANGLIATASQGSASDFFPSYWSTELRQYVNYDGHNGYDFGLSYQPLLAAGDGTVQFAGWNGSSEFAGYGLMVLINHHNGYSTLYGHLSQLLVHQGDKVSAGQEIGVSGSTGRSSGPHLHFSVFHNCQVTDPYGWTGSGTDPLQQFNGEQAQYLWLPGHDPLVLNPPPRWPTYPLGLEIPIQPAGRSTKRQGRLPWKLRYISIPARKVPPANRLLLLQLPAPRPGQPSSAPVAMARTEALVTREGESLSFYLQELQAQGLIQTYQLIPAAAAVWVRGTATAAQLEALPGVASLSGVQPRDIDAAVTGLSHSVLIQMGPQRTPSLWPMAFRSALHTWRPMTAVSNGHSLVTGFALPGQRVVVSLERAGALHGVAQVRTDPETGGFVAMLHDRSGGPVTTAPGDTVTIGSGDRRATVPIPSLTVRARSRSIVGHAAPGATVSLVLAGSNGEVTYKGILLADRTGTFRKRVPAALEAGSMAVAGTVDAAGDQQAATAFVPGLLVRERGSLVQGWTVGHAPRLTVTRAGKRMVNQILNPASDGTFEVELQSGSMPLALLPGDRVTLGSIWHHHTFVMPELSVHFPLGATEVQISGPKKQPVSATFYAADGRSWHENAVIHTSGRLRLPSPLGAVGTGDGISAKYVAGNGDTAIASANFRSIIFTDNTSLVTGRISPGTALSVHVSSSHGVQIGGGVASSDLLSGSFSMDLQTIDGHALLIRPGMHVQLWDGSSKSTLKIPSLSGVFGPNGICVSGGHTTGTGLVLTVSDQDGKKRLEQMKPAVTVGTPMCSGRGFLRSDSQRLTIADMRPDGITFARSLMIPSVASPVPANPSGKSDRQRH